MLGEPRLNVYVLDSDVSPHLRERLRAQVQTALRALPRWTFALLTSRMQELGVTVLTLVVEPAPTAENVRPLSLGDIDGRRAARLRPRILGKSIDWPQEPSCLTAKAVAFMSAPGGDSPFWRQWADAVEADHLREKAALTSPSWHDETDTGLLLEMFAAYALRDGHQRWSDLPAVHAFLQEWRDQSA